MKATHKPYEDLMILCRQNLQKDSLMTYRWVSRKENIMLSEEKTCEKMINNKEMLVGVLYKEMNICLTEQQQ